MRQAVRLHMDRHTEQTVLQSIPLVTVFAVIPACLLDAFFRRGKLTYDNYLDFGLTFYGWLLGCVIGWWVYARITNCRFEFLLNFFSPLLALAQAFGRIGCFLAGCCYGKPTSSILGICFPEGSMPWRAFGAQPLYPVQLLEALWLFGVFTALQYTVPFKCRISAYFISTGLMRFLIEYLRGDDRGYVFIGCPISPSQCIGSMLVLSGIFMIATAILHKHMKDNDTRTAPS